LKVVDLSLQQNGIDINQAEDDGTTPLHIACYKGHEIVVRLLLDNRADINPVDRDGDTALSSAKRQGHTSIVKLLETDASPLQEQRRQVEMERQENENNKRDAPSLLMPSTPPVSKQSRRCPFLI